MERHPHQPCSSVLQSCDAPNPSIVQGSAPLQSCGAVSVPTVQPSMVALQDQSCTELLPPAGCLVDMVVVLAVVVEVDEVELAVDVGLAVDVDVDEVELGLGDVVVQLEVEVGMEENGLQVSAYGLVQKELPWTLGGGQVALVVVKSV